ncbi:E3 ubiquitin-protein ligase rnf213-alpha-like, partial [Anneissia japonica]|uniref:E3 ubiquitin-protein ligase rnf213-alpha-like n=1 Tax=Anneissia japonica TaxID=1529436 RepID=UPI001425B25A
MAAAEQSWWTDEVAQTLINIWGTTSIQDGFDGTRQGPVSQTKKPPEADFAAFKQEKLKDFAPLHQEGGGRGASSSQTGQEGTLVFGDQQTNSNDDRKGSEKGDMPRKSAGSTQKKGMHVPNALRDLKEGEMMTIHFHSILAPEFQFNGETDTVYIRFGSKDLGNFQYNAVKMVPVKFQSNYVFMTGTLTVKPYYLKPHSNSNVKSQCIAYKYVVHARRKQGQDCYTYEFLYNQMGRAIVDRALMTNRMQPKANGVWHQYDGTVQHPEPTYMMRKNQSADAKSYSKRFNGWLTGFIGSSSISNRDERLAADCKFALLSYLPAWEGFLCENSKPMEPCLAIEQFLQVSKDREGIWTKQEYYEPKLWRVSGYSANEVLLQYLEGKIFQLENSDICKDVDASIKKMISALAMMHVIKKCNITIDRRITHTLLCALALPLSLCKDEYTCIVESIQEAFGPILDDLIVSLLQCCNGAMAPQTEKDVDVSWLLVVPLLHFLRGDSKPMEWPSNLDRYNYNNIVWWGHEHLAVVESRKYFRHS